MSCGVGHRRGLDLVWLWLWLAAVVLVHPPAGEPQYDMALKKKKKTKKKKKKVWKFCKGHLVSISLRLLRFSPLTRKGRGSCCREETMGCSTMGLTDGLWDHCSSREVEAPFSGLRTLGDLLQWFSNHRALHFKRKKMIDCHTVFYEFWSCVPGGCFLNKNLGDSEGSCLWTTP